MINPRNISSIYKPPRGIESFNVPPSAYKLKEKLLRRCDKCRISIHRVWTFSQSGRYCCRGGIPDTRFLSKSFRELPQFRNTTEKWTIVTTFWLLPESREMLSVYPLLHGGRMWSKGRFLISDFHMRVHMDPGQRFSSFSDHCRYFNNPPFFVAMRDVLGEAIAQTFSVNRPMRRNTVDRSRTDAHWSLSEDHEVLNPKNLPK